MDFARKQLEKYGWTDGKGLGKHENGISEALKPKLKRSVAGVGHDPAAEFNEHWWTTLYDKAAANIEVKEKNGKTKKIKSKEGEEFVITNNTWKLNKKPKDTEDDEQYSEHFVRTAVLTNGANKVERVIESESENEVEKKDVLKMTDEELYAACEGRTAHKGARHGLLATGKLARIAQQEALLLLQPKYNGYSHAKKLKEKVEEISLNSDSDGTERKKKKKKRKRCNSNENGKHIECDEALSGDMSFPDKKVSDENNIASDLKVGKNSRKSKKAKKDFRSIEVITEEDEEVSKPKKKKKENECNMEDTPMEITNIENASSEINSTKKSKKKKKD